MPVKSKASDAVSKYYENGCLQDFILLFMSLLTAPIVQNSKIWAGIYFIFLTNVLKQTRMSFNTNFWSQWKDRKAILALFCNLFARTLG